MTIDEMRDRKTELGYTNEKLAELSGVPLSTVQKVFAGISRHPRYKTIIALEKVLGPRYESACSDSFAEAGAVCEEAAAYGRALEPKGGYTLKDYYALPDERRVELIDGVFYDMSSPSSIHQIISARLFICISNYIFSNNGSCVPLFAPMDVQLDCDDRTMLQPDIMVVCDHDKIHERCIYGAPDLVIEILSRSTKRKDMYLKLTKYKEAGVREYWMVDPKRKQIIVYDFEHEDLVSLYGFEDSVPVGIFSGDCRVDFAEISSYAAGSSRQQ